MKTPELLGLIDEALDEYRAEQAAVATRACGPDETKPAVKRPPAGSGWARSEGI